MKLHLKIIDLDGIYFDGDVDLVNLTIASGNVTILANHLPLISSIDISHMYFKNDGETKEFAIAGGTLFVSDHDCKIIADAIEAKDDIDFERALRAKQRAEELLSSMDATLDYNRAQKALKKALNRLTFK